MDADLPAEMGTVVEQLKLRKDPYPVTDRKVQHGQRGRLMLHHV
jgi:hypothetical protein